MGGYISSYANRFYTALESGFGEAAAITGVNRIPAVKLAIRQQLEAAERRDKTGSRTFAGYPPGGRRRTRWELQTYMTSWAGGGQQPGYGPLFQGCLGSTPVFWAGGTAGAGSSGTTLVFGGAHGLAPGQAVSYGGEIRFVTAVADSTTVTLNAPFSAAPQAGAAIGGSCCYTPATELPSVTIFDYWTPATAVQRLLCGAAVNRMEIRVNGDFHEFVFGGEAQDLIDSSSFAAGMGQLTAFPQEPALAAFDYSIVPGHMGQAWLGTSPEQFFTITGATFSVDNGVELRAREFGSNVPKGISPGRRSVTVDFDLYQLDDNACKGLYQAARQQSPISVMFQLGEQAGQLVGVHLKSVLAEAPQYDDSDTRLQWRFKSGRAQGTVDDEIVVAFA